MCKRPGLLQCLNNSHRMRRNNLTCGLSIALLGYQSSNARQAHNTEGAMMKTTKHTCGGPVFGKRTAGCPRCDELANGAAPAAHGYFGTARHAMHQMNKRIDAMPHICTESCGEVCTWGQW